MNDILNLLWANNTAMGRIIIILIVCFGIAGGLSAMKHRRRYLAREREWLDVVRDRLRRAQDARQLPVTISAEGVTEGALEEAAPPDPQPAASGLLIELAELMEGIPPDTLIGDRLVSIVRMKQARAKVNIDALQQSTMLKESANSGLTFPA